MKVFSKEYDISTVLMSLLLGIFIDIKCLNLILVSYGLSEEGGLMNVLYLSVVSAIVFVALLHNAKSIKNLNKSYFIIAVYSVISYFITTMFLGEPYTSFIHFLVFTLSALTLPFLADIDCKLVLQSVILVPVVGIFKIDSIFVYVTDWNQWISMGLSYAFITPILASVVYIVYYAKRDRGLEKILCIALCIVNFIYLTRVFQFGSRGPIMCLLSMFMFFFVIKRNEIGQIRIKFSLLLLTVIGLFIFANFFDSFLFLISDYLENNGISSHAIDKFILLTAEGNIAHGRDQITEKAFEGILSSPLFGNGFDLFDYYNNGLSYPHNSLIQILYDGGILLFCIIVLPVYRGIKDIFRYCSFDSYSLFTFLLFAGVPGSMLSGDLWRQSILWVFIGFMISGNLNKKSII